MTFSKSIICLLISCFIQVALMQDITEDDEYIQKCKDDLTNVAFEVRDGARISIDECLAFSDYDDSITDELVNLLLEYTIIDDVDNLNALEPLNNVLRDVQRLQNAAKCIGGKMMNYGQILMSSADVYSKCILKRYK